MKTVFRKTAAFAAAVLLLISSAAGAFSSDISCSEAYADTADVLLSVTGKLTPNATGAGEWVVLGLSRGGYEIPGADREIYLEKVRNYISSNINSAGRLNKNKSTENSRIILALTSLGINAMDFEGYDLTAGLNELDYLKRQGINGPIWALLALDSHGYPVAAPPEGKTQLTREQIVDYILSQRLADGGWALSGSKSDPDITAMTLQALAKYRGKVDGVDAAVEEALECLSGMQLENGGYDSWGTVNSESTAQVITALCQLGIDPSSDKRFVKDGSPVDALMEFYVEGEGFKHILSSGTDGMATEQAFYALTAYKRLKDGKTSLYDMTDTGIPHEHIMSGWIVDWEPDYVNKGQKHRECVLCGTVLRTSVTPVLKCSHEHTVEQNAKDPTCTEDGRTADLFCEDCQTILKEGTVIPAAGHDFADGECTVCHEKDPEYTEDVPLPLGVTKSAYVTVNGRTYAVSPAVKQTVELITALGTDPSDEAVLAAYGKYRALTPDEKLFVDNISSLDGMTEKVAEHLHTDGVTGASVSGNVPWYVRLDLEPSETGRKELKELGNAFGTEFTAAEAWVLGFTDMLTGEQWLPQEDITVTIPSGVDGKYITAVFTGGIPTASSGEKDGNVRTFDTQQTGRLILTGHEIPLFGAEGNGRRLPAVFCIVPAAAALIFAAAVYAKKKNRENE